MAGGWHPPSSFDEYRLIRPLGHGRMGQVYLAHDTLLDRHVAVKFIASSDDAAVARFLVEARAAARIQHPNVASLYRVGQLDGRPYLISELVRGDSLDQIETPVAADRLLAIAIDLARGLAAAHRRGVLHRDLKPGNVVLAEGGEAKLLDFGLAKLVDAAAEIAEAAPRAGAPLSEDEEAALRDMTGRELLGTPYFMSPEAWRLEEASERSDLFSLGLLLYELASGAGPFRDVPLAELPRTVTGTDARPLRAIAPGVPEGLAAVVDRCLRRDPAERPASADDLLLQLEALRPGRSSRAAPRGNPYRGLRPFEPEHRALFFGRERPLGVALERLRTEPFLLVTGDSGVGKSSICAAGLVPRIAEGEFEDGRSWAIARLVPGPAPVVSLAAALAPLIGRTEGELEILLATEPEELGRAARRGLGDGAALLVYVDQLEELVTLASPEDAAAVSRALGSLAAGLPGLRLLATARSDFLSRLEALPGFRDRVSRGLFLLAALGPEEVREAVVGPASVAGARFESEELVDELVEATAVGSAMPLLSFALAELWDRRDPAEGVIRRDALEAVGGVTGALSRHADGLLVQLLPAERLAARELLLRLVTAEGTRARRTGDELGSLTPHAGAVLEALVRGRLLVATESTEGTAYEIAHEALVGGWETLAAWLAEEAEVRKLVHRIETAAADWRRHEEPRELLWSAVQLEAADAVPPAKLTPRERAFLAASRRARQRTRWLRRAAVVGLLLAGGGVWITARVAADRDRSQAIAAGLESAAAELEEARELGGQLEEARQRAFAAFDGGDPDAEDLWDRALALRARTLGAYRDASGSLERALMLAPGRADLRRRYGELLLERALLAEREGLAAEREELARRLQLYDDDGALGERWRAPASLALTTSPAGAEVVLHRYREDGDETVLERVAELGPTPVELREIPTGSLLLEIRALGREPVRHPVVARRGEALDLALALPAASAAPEGFVWIPPGASPFGSAEDESVRAFFRAVPQHPIETGGYFIARHETTFGDWLRFLEALPDEERELRTPRLGTEGVQGWLDLERTAPGRWRMAMQPGTVALEAMAGERIRYPDRTHRAEQDWLRLPVGGISFDDAAAYARWLDESGAVPGARLCTEEEWERAARGADGRRYPHGDVLRPEDANIDATYGKIATALGPDEVGSHPASASPFGVHDLAGNVWEWTLARGAPVARGGSFHFAATTARIANRETPDRDYRDLGLGVRICASG